MADPAANALHPRRSFGAVLLAGGLNLGLGLSGCTPLKQPTPIAMELLHDDSACAAQAPVLLVLLPGANMTATELVDEGFVQAVRQRRLAVDVLVVGAGLEYVYDGSLITRLHDDVLAPYRARGYSRIWLAGISLGGFAAMAYALRHPGTIEGIVALAPYLGRRPLVQEVAAAGGAAAWLQQASAVPRADDVDQQLWRWLARRTPAAQTAAGTAAQAATQPAAGSPRLVLGYGTEDRFAEGHRVLAQSLPAADVLTAPGGHTWAPWRQLWATWLDRGVLPTACA